MKPSQYILEIGRRIHAAGLVQSYTTGETDGRSEGEVAAWLKVASWRRLRQDETDDQYGPGVVRELSIEIYLSAPQGEAAELDAIAAAVEDLLDGSKILDSIGQLTSVDGVRCTRPRHSKAPAERLISVTLGLLGPQPDPVRQASSFAWWPNFFSGRSS
jgi:hypothetical protein